MTNQIELKSYKLLKCLENDESVIKNVFDYQNEDSYLCDIIMEIADSHTAIYNHQLWENAPKIQEYITEALEQGLVDTTNGIDLMKIFQVGEYQYYTELLYNNLDEIAYNYVANIVNEYISNDNLITEKIEKEEIELEEIVSFISEATNNFDHNEKIELLVAFAYEAIEMLKIQ